MRNVLQALVSLLGSAFRTRLHLEMEILALRHQLAVYQRSVKRPRLKPTDRILWIWLSRIRLGWHDALMFVKLNTVIAWQRKRFRDHRARLSRAGKPGRPVVAREVRELIRKMSRANPTWGSPRIVGELQKLGIEVAKSTVEKYMVRPRKPPSPARRALLDNHVKEFASPPIFRRRDYDPLFSHPAWLPTENP